MRTLNNYLEKIERHGERFVPKLNRSKCEAIANVANAEVKFADGCQTKRCSESKYSGCLNETADQASEIKKTGPLLVA